MKKYNVGIVGYGWVATAHIPAINATTLGQVTAVCSSRKLDAAALSAQHGGRISVYNDLDEMLANPDIHVVSLCGFPTQRLDQVIRAARAGKHLILEKPLCLSLKELRAMQKAVKQGEGQDLRLLRVPLFQPVPGHQGRPGPGPAGPRALRRGGLLPRHRPLVCPVPLVPGARTRAAAPCSRPAATPWTPCCCAWAARSSRS